MKFLLWQLLYERARRSPEKEALVCGEERLNYREVVRRVEGLASGLLNAGLRRGDRVAVHLGTSTDQVVSMFGISRAGGVFVQINDLLSVDQLLHIARDCTVKVLITATDKLDTLASMLSAIPSLEFIVACGDAPLPVMACAVYRINELCRLLPFDPGELGTEKDLAAIIYTSGSSGKPKGVMLSHANVLAGSEIVSDYLDLRESDRILTVLPLSFDAGMNQVMTSFGQGATCVLLKCIFARDIVRALVNERITGLAGVPTVWSLLVQSKSGLSNQPLPHLRYITNTGGAMPQVTLKLLREYLPTTQIFLMYGLTEAFRSTYLPPEELDRRPTSIGKAIPNTEILVLDDQGRSCKPGEIGELVHRGPTVTLGYWNRPADTEAMFRPNPVSPPELGNCEKVCFSGDLVWEDHDGFLYFLGRRDAMIKSSGYRISPTEVEEVLIQSGKLRDAAVIGIPDDLLGQSIKAFIVPRDNKSADVNDLLIYCAERMPSYMVPRAIEALSELPKTSSQKTDYLLLRRREGL